MAARDVLTLWLERLWEHYCDRVSYARRYCELVTAQGGRIANDHIAFRTFNCLTGKQPAGIEAIARVITTLGYRPAGTYEFADKHLFARHFEHPDPLSPKIFISQLEVDRLSSASADLVRQAVADARDPLDEDARAMLVSADRLAGGDEVILADKLFRFITTRPWQAPKRDAVIEINKESQYAAWTLLHGNSVNHFTAYINEQQVAQWPDIEATVGGLRAAGVPMKPEVEGQPGSKLRQSATEAVDEECEVIEADGRAGRLKWSYAYYELAERGMVPGPDGRPVRFNGFLGPQATHLFEMTRRS